MQPYIFPYIGYFQLIDSVDKFITYTHVNYTKRSWINRNRIFIINNKSIYFSIPIKKSHTSTYINTIEIDYSTNWKIKLYKDIIHNYKRSPFFDEIHPIIKKILEPDFKYLYQLNFYAIKTICQYLNITTELVLERPYFKELEEYINSLQSKTIRIEKRIIEICKKEEAEMYVNAIGGKELYSQQSFNKQSIKLKFIKTLNYYYPQNTPNFQPDLSIIDILMNCGIKGSKKILKNYKLID